MKPAPPAITTLFGFAACMTLFGWAEGLTAFISRPLLA
jgi:hypothetical protein